MRSIFKKRKRKPAPTGEEAWKGEAAEIYEGFFRPIENIVTKALMDHRIGAVRHGVEKLSQKFTELQDKLDSEDGNFVILGDAFGRFFQSIGQRTIAEGDSITLTFIMEKMVQLSSTMPTARFTACYEIFYRTIDDLMAQAEKRFEGRKAELVELRLKMADAQVDFAQKAGYPACREPEELAQEPVISAREIYLQEAIVAYKEALEFYGPGAPSKTAGINNSLGNAYGDLSEVRDKEENIALAIDSFREALKVYRLDAFPIDYAMTQNNLGNAYSGLSEVRDKDENLALAISAYREALKIYTQKDFPDLYHKAKANLEKVIALKERS